MEKITPIYTGVFLDFPERLATIRSEDPAGGGDAYWFSRPRRGSDWVEVFERHCHHMTIEYMPSESSLLALLPHMGRWVELWVTGVARDKDCTAVVVECSSGPVSLLVQNPVPHVTVETRVGVPPHYSNKLLSPPNRYEDVRERLLSQRYFTGRVGVFCSDGEVRWDLSEL